MPAVSELINEKCEQFNSTKCKLRKVIIVNDIVRTLEKLWLAKFYVGPYYDVSNGSLQHWRELSREEVLKKVRQALNDKNKQKKGRKKKQQEQHHDEEEDGTNNQTNSRRQHSVVMRRLSSSLRSLLSLQSIMSWRREEKSEEEYDESMGTIHGMMFEQDVYFSTPRGDEDLLNDAAEGPSSSSSYLCLGNKRYQELRSSYSSNSDSFHSASCSQRKMIAREIVTKMENLGCSFLSDEEESKRNLEQKWKILDKESAIEKVYQDLNSDDRGGVENMEMEDFNKNISSMRHDPPLVPRSEAHAAHLVINKRQRQQQNQHQQHQEQYYTLPINSTTQHLEEVKITKDDIKEYCL